jgi:hypothetical protein
MSKQISATIQDESLVEKVSEYAKTQNRSFSQMVEILLATGLYEKTRTRKHARPERQK